MESQLTGPEEYQGFVDEVVENRNERDHADPESVAQTVIVSFRMVGDEVAEVFVAEPYRYEAVDPYSVLYWSERGYPETVVDCPREAAVEILARDLAAHPDWIDNPTA